ncbi:hypothetical protein RJ640_015228, partial [Escallonia rubra]
LTLASRATCLGDLCAVDTLGWEGEHGLAGEKTKVTGTLPPCKRSWTGYVKKDTAAQTNIYSTEISETELPAVYVAESAISPGNAGSYADGADNNASIVAGLALISIAASSFIILQLGKTPPSQILEISGPSLSCYISKFKPPEVVQASVPVETETSTSAPTTKLCGRSF